MQFRKTTNLALVATVAAMLAASPSIVRAQDTAMPAPAPMADTMPMSGSMSDMGTPDFSLLNNKTYDYVDLQQAKARGLSDNQIATIAKIAKESDVSFNTVAAGVDRGETFPFLAGQYNLKIGDVYSNSKEKQEIDNYMAAYDAASLKGAMRPMNGDSMTMPMANMPMTPATTASMAPATMDIVETAMSAKNLTTLVKALQVAGLVDTLKTAGPFTVFAPSNAAFAKLPAGKLDELLADPAMLKTVLTYHVIPGEITASDAKAMTSPTSPPTVEGDTLQVTQGKKGHLMINDARVIKGDIRATNGVIHIIDTVLIPPMAAK